MYVCMYVCTYLGTNERDEGDKWWGFWWLWKWKFVFDSRSLYYVGTWNLRLAVGRLVSRFHL